MVAAFLARNNDDAYDATIGFAWLSVAIADLIAIPILRRRLIPPCVRVKKASQSGAIAMTVVSFLFTAFVIFLLVTKSLRSFGMMIFMGLTTVSIIIYLILGLFEKIQICGNGVWRNGWFSSWEEFKSFSWQWKTKDSVELKLSYRSWIWPTRLVVTREDRETVHQLLEANLPEVSK